LFAGCGTGEEIIAVARAGARVTAVDYSPRMLGRLARRAREARVTIEPRPTDIRTLQPDSDGRFDIVVAHYFLNVFAPEDMRDMLRHLANLARPGGRLVIADFAPPRANGLRARLQQAYYYTALTTFRMLARNAWHPIYDYATELRRTNLRLELTRDFPLPGKLLPGYRVWVALAEHAL
jgi:demethylmenaquinone methyltransferase/2-methoxy-6-polyprenyl-1,4-benzoquinol methylase